MIRLRRAVRRRCRPGAATVGLVVVAVLTGCSTGPTDAVPARPGLADPPTSASTRPVYDQVCAPAGVDVSAPCLALVLGAIDRARAAEGLAALRVPADLAGLTVPEQLLAVVDAERVDRGLAPFVALDGPLSAAVSREAADQRASPAPVAGYRSRGTDWLGGVVNGLDADYAWLYEDGPGAGLSGCGPRDAAGCWVDRHLLLTRTGPGTTLVLGAAVAPGPDGQSSLAISLAVPPARGPVPLFTWAQVKADLARGVLRPLAALPQGEAATGIADPPVDVAPRPDFAAACASTGFDTSPTCLTAVVAAVDRARSLEGVRPLVLPSHFAELPVPVQLFVAIDAERVDRGLAPFVGMTAGLDAVAARGAQRSNDPPDPGRAYLLVDGEWAGGSANGLDAVYGFMYDDGYGSGNLDCGRPRAAGCWGHRHGVLDDFGTGPALVMGAAALAHGDTTAGDRGGTSMAATLAVAAAPPHQFVYTWAQALADLPPGAPPGG